MKKGKLIVIDGTDGSGKATQAARLVKNLRKAKFKVKVEDFPQYGKKSAVFVEKYLNGEFGGADKLGPYIPSFFYALDRFAAANRIRQNLKRGYIAVCNRYVTANMGHQGGKVKNAKDRDKYFKWLFDLEFGLFKIPRPDLTLILQMPAEIAQKLVDQKEKRAYARGKKRDLHEADLSHQKAAETTYLEIARKFRYPIIECYKDGKILSRQEIADLVWKKVKKNLKKGDCPRTVIARPTVRRPKQSHE